MTTVTEAAKMFETVYGPRDPLAGDELAVLNAIRARLEAGKRQYGQLDIKRDNRNWLKELQEELLDACVYLECARRRAGRGAVSVRYTVSVDGRYATMVDDQPLWLVRSDAFATARDARRQYPDAVVRVIRVTRYRRAK